MLHSMTIRLIQVDQLETPDPYLFHGVKCQPVVIWSHWGQKVILKMLLFVYVNSVTIRLMHVHQLKTFYLKYGIKCQPGVMWDHRGQKVIFSKNATSTKYMVLSIHVIQCIYVTPQNALTWDSLLQSLGQGQSAVPTTEFTIIDGKCLVNFTFVVIKQFHAILCNEMFLCYDLLTYFHILTLTEDGQPNR